MQQRQKSGRASCPDRRDRTMRSTRSAASVTSSCSHTRRLSHPATASSASTLRSRSTFAESLAFHHCALFFGAVACSGHPCQKQPSTNTATRDGPKTTSARLRIPRSGDMSTRYLTPRACNSRRSASSGLVSRRRCLRSRPRTASDNGSGDMPATVLEPAMVDNGGHSGLPGPGSLSGL